MRESDTLINASAKALGLPSEGNVDLPLSQNALREALVPTAEAWIPEKQVS